VRGIYERTERGRREAEATGLMLTKENSEIVRRGGIRGNGGLEKEGGKTVLPVKKKEAQKTPTQKKKSLKFPIPERRRH